MVMYKFCNKCGISKPLDYFYAHPAAADGRQGSCKACRIAAERARRALKGDEIRAYDRARSMLPHRVQARKEYRKTDAGRASHAAAQDRARTAYPERYAARTAVSNALRLGKLTRCPCELCGEAKVEAHHDDYSRPLDVRWLCKTHHDEHHGA